MIRAAWTFFLLIILAAPASAQVIGGMQRPGVSGEEKPVTGTAMIRGRVVSAATGQPLRRAQVRLSAPELKSPRGRTAGTDLDGYYEIAELPAGRYTISVTRSGHLRTQHGQRHPGEPGSPVQLADGERLDINFALQRAGRISGRVTDETGEPVADITIHVLEQQYFQGRRRLVPVSFGGLPGYRTDESGHYRLHGLPPGTYYVTATSRETWASEDDPDVTYGHTPSYYPGVRSHEMAQPVKVGIGQDVEAIDFGLVAARTVTLSGRAFGLDGQPLGGSTVTLEQRVQGPSMMSMSSHGQAPVADDGTWVLKKVSPGEYTVALSRRAQDGRRERGGVSVVVDESDIDGLVVTVDPGAIVAGQVTVEGGMPLPPKLRIMTVPPQGAGVGSGSQPAAEDGYVDESGRFAWLGVSGPVLISATPLPPGWAIRSVEAGGQEFVERPIELAKGQRLDGVRVVLTTRFPAIVGAVTDERGQPADGTVLLFPADEARWFESEAARRTTRPDQSGTYRFASVRPGEYLAIALESVAAGQSRDPEFLESLRGRATTVRLQEGEDGTVNLRVQR